jgi:phosphoglycerate kinase
MSSSSIPPTPEGATRKRNVFDVLETLNTSGDVGKVILVRVDFNVPMNSDGIITDDSRIRGALPTIKAIVDANHNALLVSHMGRPNLVQKGDFNDVETTKQKHDLSLKPVAEYLSKLLEKPILFGDDCMNAQSTVSALKSGSGNIALLENLRFYKKEEKNDTEFAKTLASYCDAYINDAFGTCHRAHASVSGVPECFTDKALCGIGILVANELAYLDFKQVTENDKISAIIGGSKVSTKLPVIQGLLGTTNTLVLGGGLAFTFLKALGIPIGTSLVEESMIDTAKQLMDKAQRDGIQMVIPIDAVCAKTFPKGPIDKSETIIVDTVPGSNGIPDGYMGLDAGPKTIALFLEALAGSTKLVFNGPMGVFEVVPFDEGTRGLVDGIANLTKSGTITVVGGGDSVAAMEAFGKTNEVSYISTGGGATLELLAGDKLPGVEAISDF